MSLRWLALPLRKSIIEKNCPNSFSQTRRLFGVLHWIHPANCVFTKVPLLPPANYIQKAPIELLLFSSVPANSYCWCDPLSLPSPYSFSKWVGKYNAWCWLSNDKKVGFFRLPPSFHPPGFQNSHFLFTSDSTFCADRWYQNVPFLLRAKDLVLGGKFRLETVWLVVEQEKQTLVFSALTSVWGKGSPSKSLSPVCRFLFSPFDFPSRTTSGAKNRESWSCLLWVKEEKSELEWREAKVGSK